MSDLGNIDGTYKEGMVQKKRKNYLRAARWFRMCQKYYEYGELPVYYKYLEEYGLDSFNQYEYCKSKLTEETQQMLDQEEKEHFGSWREFVKFDYMKIKEEYDMPSDKTSRT